MPEYATVEGEILRACDLCHSRKIRCDRRAPCANCVDAGIECRRLRRGRSSKKRTLQSVLNPQERLLDFDGQPRHVESLGSRTDDIVENNSYETQDAPEMHHPESNDGHDSTEKSPAATTRSVLSADGSKHHAIQARNIIQLELDDSRCISRERQSILRSALQLVSRVAENDPLYSATTVEEEPWPTDSDIALPGSPPRELLFMLLQGPPESVSVRWPDHLSNKAYERMAIALLQNSHGTDEQMFHRYCICVYVKGIFHLYQLSRTTNDPFMKHQLSQSRSAYISATIRSIERLNILKGPNLPTVQALISAALLMQHLGRLNQCWVLTSYAARQIVSLNYHTSLRAPANSDLERDVNSVVYWCYYLDRTLSSLLGRPTSLPDLDIAPTDLIVLDPSSPYDNLLRVLLDLAQVQGKLHSIPCTDSILSNSSVLETCQLLESRMQSVLLRLQSDRSLLPKMVQYDWVAADFCFYAIFVEVYRTLLKCSFSPHIHRECLLCARKSLKAFHFLQQHPEEMPGFQDPYPSFLAWTLFLYPLSAFFVVFCNIVGTLDYGDYELMRDIIERLSHFKDDPHLRKLLNLLQSLERLCEPLFSGNGGGVPATENIALNGDEPALFARRDERPVGPTTLEGFVDPLRDDLQGVDGRVPDTEVDFSADWLMWQLFNSQVPATWFHKDYNYFDANSFS
ncbi:hypothetical protein BDV59DRAFT_178104 [Aspergillus ambiguus]|uniref:Zn(II)2Cys6 transcription factor n=1 Tax=Aspergillus ambiguus TaxID=176160 RepID=UPI003CCD1E02